jgi:glycosyltransferase involved in cell wall biosynthesis
MRVGFDVSPLERPASRGLARVVAELTGALERRGVLTVVRLAPAAGEGLRRWRHRELPRRVAAEDLVGLHSFTSAFPLLGPGRRVQTIHELPWRHGVRENAGLRHRAWSALGSLRADRVVVPSEHVALALGRARRKVRVVPWGVAPAFRAEPPPGTVDEAVLARYRLGEEPFVLCPGAVRAKKNLAALLGALVERKRLGQEPLRVLVTGGDTPDLRADLGLASRLGLARWVTTLDEVDEADLPALYRLARAVVVLSRSEGFALPVLEGLACGVPVVVPRASAQAEVAGAAGVAVEALEPASVAAGLERALSERAHLGAAGVERARAFTWEASAERIEGLWRELA